MLKNITAVEYDGSNAYALTIAFEIPDENFDLLAAARKATGDYCKTEDGRAVYEGNCECFNWGDFADIPNEFCEKHGFRMVGVMSADEVVNLNEQLVAGD